MSSSTKEDRIRRAMERVRDKGFEVAPGGYGIGFDLAQGKWRHAKLANKRVCPLGALVVVEQPPCKDSGPIGSVPAAVAALLGVDLKWVLCFSWKFDGHSDSCACEACELGSRLRAEIDGAQISS